MATAVAVQLVYGQDKLVVSVEDNGRGFSIPDGSAKLGHFGLQGMRERAASLGAEGASDLIGELVEVVGLFVEGRVGPGAEVDDPGDRFDYLFVDEAGQVCLANLVAMAACARNIVLVGDQMQLPQPVQGVHPGETGLSCLDYLLQGRATVAPDMGILLDTTWRMHPSLCSLISDAIYDGRLKAHPRTEGRRILGVAGAPPEASLSGAASQQDGPVVHVGFEPAGAVQ